MSFYSSSLAPLYDLSYGFCTTIIYTYAYYSFLGDAATAKSLKYHSTECTVILGRPLQIIEYNRKSLSGIRSDPADLAGGFI
jgi:hypothetical protein